MPRKFKSAQQKNKKAIKRKTSIGRLFLILIAIITVLSFLVFSIYIPKRSNNHNKQYSSYSNSGPSFRKDGRLNITAVDNSNQIWLDIEIADNEQERMQGLMFRQSLQENEGMLFIFSDEEPRSFWMKNTFISLDIIYINARNEIVSIQKYTQPNSTYPIPSEKPAMYVLEVNSGFADNHGINPGDKIDF